MRHDGAVQRLNACGRGDGVPSDPRRRRDVLYAQVLNCKGFTAFRESCGEEGPFAGCPMVLELAAKVGEREKVAAVAGIFDQAPV